MNDQGPPHRGMRLRARKVGVLAGRRKNGRGVRKGLVLLLKE
jgi:hypothetical protein